MNQKNIILKTLLKMVVNSLLLWIVLVLVIYLLGGSWKAAIPVGILIIIARAIYFYSDFANYKSEIESKQSKKGSKSKKI